jgi:hypothetical protein
VLICSGVNEKGGGATDREDPRGRLKLLETNASVYRDVIPHIVAAAPDAVLVAVTDPPDPLADLTRALAGHDRVLSTGTTSTRCASAPTSPRSSASTRRRSRGSSSASTARARSCCGRRCASTARRSPTR